MRKVLCIGALAAGLYYCTPAEPTGLYVSVTQKGAVSTFYNRLATNDHQVVLTSQASESARQSLKLEYVEGFRYCLVELQDPDQGMLVNQVASMDGIRVIRVRNEITDLHEVVPPEDYIECQAEELSSVPEYNEPIEPGYLLRDSFSENRDFNLTITIDPSYLEEKLNQFTGAVPTVIDGQERRITERRSTANKTLARQWLKQEYEALGYTVTMSSYSSGVNFIAEREGADNSRYLAVSAHLDSVGNAGADDDASGIIGSLAMADALKDTELGVNLRFVGFDEEERGLVGSKAMARSLNSSGDLDQMIGLINIEMLGYDEDSDGGFHVIDCDENSSADLTTIIMQAHARDGLGLRKTPACTNRSDHAAFWRYNKPAVVISQNFFGGDSNPCYHRSCDKVDSMDFDYAARISTLLGRSVEYMVRSK